jgi:hypothetical protein
MRTRMLAVGLAAAAAIAIPVALPAAANAQPEGSEWQCSDGAAPLIGGIYVVVGLQCVNYGSGGTFGVITIPAGYYYCDNIVDVSDGITVLGTGCSLEDTS